MRELSFAAEGRPIASRCLQWRQRRCCTGFSPLQISPRGDRVLVKVGQEETKTRGGILLPTSAIKKPTSGTALRQSSGLLRQ